MNNTRWSTIFVLTLFLMVLPPAAQGQPYGMGPGMMGGYGYGYGMGPGMMGGWGYLDIPSKLTPPQDNQWVQKLREILALEKQSLAQYQSDQDKFNAHMPYVMVIPQEENHIQWLTQLFEAYGLSAQGEKTPATVDTKTLEQAYEQASKMETELLPRYEWLVKHAGDHDTERVLNTILLQSRWHLVMFEHALRMGHGYGYSSGYGMMGGYGTGYGMGPGMMGGYDGGWGMMGGGFYQGSGPGRQYQPTGKTITMKEAQSLLNDYLKSSRNPNLKLGPIKDAGNAYEAEIMTKHNDLVDKVIVDKYTGWIRSAY